MTQSLFSFLDKCSEAYYSGKPIISDQQFDMLQEMCGYQKVGAKVVHAKTSKHKFQMYSLQKFFIGEGTPPLQDYQKAKATTPKLDGAAVSFLYVDGWLVEALTRGDGTEGQVITQKFVGNPQSIVPLYLEGLYGSIQVTGEIVTTKDKPNARNYAAGALNLNSVDEFNSRELYFVAYDVHGITCDYYEQELDELRKLGFKTVLEVEFCEQFPQDGTVIRISSNEDFDALGFTSKHPRGAYAVKTRSNGVPTVLREVIWQCGRSGKVTPVAIFDPVVLDGAHVTRATLNNVGYIKALDLDIGDTVYVARMGEIIPGILRSEKPNDMRNIQTNL
jgi:DNA ligase (NAD+)